MIRFLLSSLVDGPSTNTARILRADVSAYAPRMQRTALELGFWH
ncbi:MAG: hypothetical protein R2857_03140 [Vampirovibrionales bacterium]